MFRRWWWIILVMAVVGPVLGFVGAAAVTYVMPKKYQSTAVVQVMPEKPQMAAGGEPEVVPSMPSRFLATEMEVIRAEKTLERVVDALDLSMRWGLDRGQAIGMVRETLDLEPIRGTDLIQLRVRHTHPEDARDIAMATAQAYRDRRAEFARERSEAGLAILDKELRELEEKLEESKKERDGILDTMGGEGDSAGNPVARERFLVAQREYDSKREQLETMRVRTQAERIQFELPSNPVVIHEQATIGRAPVSPNVSLNLVLGLVAGLPIGLLLALPLIMVAEGIARRKKHLHSS